MAAMTPNSDWWGRAKLPPRPQPIEIRKREPIFTLRKDHHEATLETRIVHGVGDELIFSINGHFLTCRVRQPRSSSNKPRTPRSSEAAVSSDNVAQGLA
jgi:hypothetical protein